MLNDLRNTQTTPTYYEPAMAETDREQHELRVQIDEVATLRGLTIQMSLRVMSLAATSEEEERAQVIAEFQALHAQFKSNLEILFGTTPPTTGNAQHINWIRSIVARNPTRRATLQTAEDNIAAMADTINNGKTPSFAEARAFFDTNWPIMRDKMTEVIWDLWADLDAQKSGAVQNNLALRKTIQETLANIKKFSSAIRMIAINSAVLAAHPRDAGAGFKVISREVKQLSEDIDSSTSRAQRSIADLL